MDASPKRVAPNLSLHRIPGTDRIVHSGEIPDELPDEGSSLANKVHGPTVFNRTELKRKFSIKDSDHVSHEEGKINTEMPNI
jgi:hypothetical protein